MKPEKRIEELVRNLREPPGAAVHARILGNLLETLGERKRQSPAPLRPELRRIVMRSPITKLAAAALVVLAAALSVSLFMKSTPTASAAEVFYQAAHAMAKLTSFHLRMEMRTPPGDNFATIGLDYDFVPIDFWKQVTDDEWGRWRLEEPGRVVVMDGQRSTMLMKPNHVVESVHRSPERYWRESLVELGDILTREAERAAERPADFSSFREPGNDGRDKVVITVEAKARVSDTDYLRNKYIDDSDHLKIYRFDAETKLLEDAQIYVHADGQDVLVFRLVRAEYNIDLDPGLFHLELPPDAIRLKTPDVLPDNEKYEAMTPKEAATAFFTACAREDWGEVLKFLGRTDVSQRFKDYLGGLEVIEVGEPFQSSGYVRQGWFIPYRIRLRSGEIREHNLALRNDNQAHRFQLDGGI